ncbi:MAG: ATP-binding protein [Paracoccaceae bacterium]|nr:ATP-binding protein [Paracoccaceae bacterium]
MPERVGPASTLVRAAVDVAPRLDVLAALAGACLVGSMVLDGSTGGMVLLFAGSAVATLGIAVGLAQWGRQRHLRGLRAILSRVVDHDAAPSLTAKADGRVIHANAAAIARFAPESGATIVSVLSGLVASPGPLLHRLRTAAEATGAASEDITLRRGFLRVSVHSVGADSYLWRLEDIADRPSSGPGAEAIGLPMFTVTKAGTVPLMNDALRRLIGPGAEQVSDIVADLPIRSGMVHRLLGEAGPFRAVLHEVVSAAGRREVYVLPAPDIVLPSSDWQFFDALPVAMLKIARSGDVQMANRLARDLLAHRAPLGCHLSDLVEGLGRPVGDWLDDATRGHGLNRTEVVRAIHPTKDVFLQITLGRIEDDGETALVAVLNDATELKTLEAQFVQSQKMQAIGQLAGGVAHDFNNLLTAISGHCDLMLLRHDEGDPNYGDLIQIHQNANRAASLVGQLLAFSRKQNLQLELLDLRDTMSDLTHLLNRLVGEKVTLELDHDVDLKLVRADKRQIEQVIMNLVVNARDAMPEGGVIKIETRLEELSRGLARDRVEVPPGEYVVVKVSDQGIGIPGETISKIFEPFFSTKKTGEGTGLGLSTAYGIVKQTGGFIFADSVLGQGTSFTIYLKAQDPPVQHPVHAEIPGSVEPSGHGEGVVLLVEDEAPVRAFASRALRMRGYTVLEADSAEEALRTLEDADLEIDVFVTDVIMPGMDGPSWVREALKQRPETKVVFVSGYAEDSVAESQSRIPNSVFLPKPFSLNQLTTTVQAQIQ